MVWVAVGSILIGGCVETKSPSSPASEPSAASPTASGRVSRGPDQEVPDGVRRFLSFNVSGRLTAGNPAVDSEDCGKVMGRAVGWVDYTWNLTRPASATEEAVVRNLTIRMQQNYTVAGVRRAVYEYYAPDGKQFARMENQGFALGMPGTRVGFGTAINPAAPDASWGAWKMVLRICASGPHDYHFSGSATYVDVR